MSYLTFSILRNKRGELIKEARLAKAFDEQVHHFAKVFLSHRHKDKGIVQSAVGFLRKFGADLYIDWMDDILPDKTNSETAQRIKLAIKDASKFILLATPNSLESKWIPWELGLGDSKGTSNIAIMPLLENSNYWEEREYYSIYGRIATSTRDHWCWFPPNGASGTRLAVWLHN